MLKKFLVSSVVVIGIPVMTFVLLVLFPSWSYARQSESGNVTIYSQSELPEKAWEIVNESIKLIKYSELYDPAFRFDLCLDEGAAYPRIMERIQGPAFAYGYYNKVVMASEADFEDNVASWRGREWYLDEVIAHEMIHCLQFNAFGFSTLNTAFWKHEGYCEVIAGRHRPDHTLRASIIRMVEQEGREDHHEWSWVELERGGIPYPYLRGKVMVQYLMEVEKLSYREVLEDERPEELVERDMREWYAEAL